MTHHPHRKIPSWVILTLGTVGTGAAVIWSGGLHDSTDGTPLLDETVVKLLVALIGGAVTILTLLLQRTGAVEHELKPNSGSSTRDAINRIEQMLTEQGKDIGGIRQEIRDDRRATADRFDTVDDRLHTIERRTRP